jgi:hypothetical protein
MMFLTSSHGSADAVTWAQLPALHPVLLSSCLKIKGRFQGNAAHEYKVQEAANPLNSIVPPEVSFPLEEF